MQDRWIKGAAVNFRSSAKRRYIGYTTNAIICE